MFQHINTLLFSKKQIYIIFPTHGIERMKEGRQEKGRLEAKVEKEREAMKWKERGEWQEKRQKKDRGEWKEEKTKKMRKENEKNNNEIQTNSLENEFSPKKASLGQRTNKRVEKKRNEEYIK